MHVAIKLSEIRKNDVKASSLSRPTHYWF